MRKKTPKQAKHGGAPRSGRPRRPTISEKEELEKTRSLARRSSLRAMQGYVDQLEAMKTEFYQGVPVANVVDWATRQKAQDAILEAAGAKRAEGDSPADVGRALAEAFAKLGGK